MSNTRERIKEFIINYFLEHCYAPSYDEICEGVGISKGRLHDHMKRLFLDGFLVTDLSDSFGKPRAYRPKGYKCIKESDTE